MFYLFEEASVETSGMAKTAPLTGSLSPSVLYQTRLHLSPSYSDTQWGNLPSTLPTLPLVSTLAVTLALHSTLTTPVPGAKFPNERA